MRSGRRADNLEFFQITKAPSRRCVPRLNRDRRPDSLAQSYRRAQTWGWRGGRVVGYAHFLGQEQTRPRARAWGARTGHSSCQRVQFIRASIIRVQWLRRERIMEEKESVASVAWVEVLSLLTTRIFRASFWPCTHLARHTHTHQAQLWGNEE